MRGLLRARHGATVAGVGVTFLACLLLAGCGSRGSAFDFFGAPFFTTGTTTNTVGPGTSTRTNRGTVNTSDRTPVDPCTESQARKFVKISMRNASSDYVHYFLVLVAFVNGTTYPDGGVCAADIPLYTAFGYVSVPDGTARAFGNYCIIGPALFYFHDGGQFRTAGGTGTTGLASAIAPAQGATPTFDSFFSSAGATVPVPDIILFHNPGTGEGAALKVSISSPSPCSAATTVGPTDPVCRQDAFYYVDQNDRLAGSTALGTGSGRRVPNEIQGTGCECLGVNEPFQVLAPSHVGASAANCDEFFRGGSIDYVFVRSDTDPPFPQLVWRVTDSTGGRAHDYDPRANIR